jgi:hypothetical protein
MCASGIDVSCVSMVSQINFGIVFYYFNFYMASPAKLDKKVTNKINIRYRFKIRYSGKKLMIHSFHLISQHKFVSLFD